MIGLGNPTYHSTTTKEKIVFLVIAIAIGFVFWLVDAGEQDKINAAEATAAAVEVEKKSYYTKIDRLWETPQGSFLEVGCDTRHGNLLYTTYTSGKSFSVAVAPDQCWKVK